MKAMRTVFASLLVLAGLLQAAETSKDWADLEVAATHYVGKSDDAALSRLQEAALRCASGPLHGAEAKDQAVANAWKAVQEAAQPLVKAPGDADRARFWGALQAYFWAKAWWRLRESAAGYIRAKSPDPKSGAAWARKFKDRVATREESTKLGFEEAAQSVILDWMTDYEKDLTAKKPAAILEACRIFCWAHENAVALPGLVLEGLQKENRMTKFAKYLDEEAKISTAQKPETN